MHFLFFVTDLKNEYLCWLIKMPHVLPCGRLERPYRMAFLMGSQRGKFGFRTLWMEESVVGNSFGDSDAVGFFPAPSYDSCSLTEDCLSSLTKASIATEFPFHYCFIRIFPLSCLWLISPAPLWSPCSTVCTLPPVTSLQAFSHHIHYYLDGDIQERPAFALSSLLRQPLCRIT